MTLWRCLAALANQLKVNKRISMDTNKVISYTLPEVSALIRQWANDRNIINGLNPASQFLKLIEEWSEAFTAGNNELLKDGVGDSYVVLTIIAAMHKIDIETVAYDNIDFDDVGIKFLGELAGNIARKRDITVSLGQCISCLSTMAESSHLLGEGFTLTEAVCFAYHEIKDRKGIVKDGVFIKQSDL